MVLTLDRCLWHFCTQHDSIPSILLLLWFRKQCMVDSAALSVHLVQCLYLTCHVLQCVSVTFCSSVSLEVGIKVGSNFCFHKQHGDVSLSQESQGTVRSSLDQMVDPCAHIYYVMKLFFPLLLCAFLVLVQEGALPHSKVKEKNESAFFFLLIFN